MPLTRSKPAAEVDFSIALVRRLLQQQHADLAQLPITEVESGWDNQMYRLGDELVVRLPRRKLAVDCLQREQRWLPQLAARLPLPVPMMARQGQPGCGFPWPWGVMPWLPGQPVDQAGPRADQDLAWVELLRALHQPAPRNLPASRYRGMPLVKRAPGVEVRLSELAAAGLIGEVEMGVWHRALDAPMDGKPTWIHGDLHQRNVLVAEGRWSAVIDWGDVSVGDRSVDLASIWMLLPSADSRRRAVAEMTEVTAAQWQRAQGWAIFFAALLLHTGLVDEPRHAAMGKAIFERLKQDA